MPRAVDERLAGRAWSCAVNRCGLKIGEFKYLGRIFGPETIPMVRTFGPKILPRCLNRGSSQVILLGGSHEAHYQPRRSGNRIRRLAFGGIPFTIADAAQICLHSPSSNLNTTAMNHTHDFCRLNALSTQHSTLPHLFACFGAPTHESLPNRSPAAICDD
jgi:hypothetical protein